MPMTPEQEEKVDELNRGVAGVNERLDTMRDSQRFRTIVGVCAVAVALIIGVGGALVGWSGRNDAHDAARALTAFKAQTVQTRIDSCKSSNIDRAGERRAAKRDAHDLIVQAFVVTHHEPTAEPYRSIIEGLDRRHGPVIDENIPDRLCTPAGVACYLGLARKPCDAYVKAPKEG